MNIESTPDILLLMTLSLFVLGMVAFVSGMVILLSRSLGRDVRQITRSTRKVAEKALSYDLSGLIGNASMLLTATNDMVRTGAGVGAFLMIVGSIMDLIAIGLYIYFYGGAPAYDILSRLP